MKTNILVTLQYEAQHCWLGCPFEEVGFLKHPHRHLFYIEIEKAVAHSDRDIEIIMFKQQVYNYIDAKYNHQFGSKSCEMLAEELLIQFDCHCVSVKEDNENGAKVYNI